MNPGLLEPITSPSAAAACVSAGSGIPRQDENKSADTAAGHTPESASTHSNKGALNSTRINRNTTDKVHSRFIEHHQGKAWLHSILDTVHICLALNFTAQQILKTTLTSKYWANVLHNGKQSLCKTCCGSQLMKHAIHCVFWKKQSVEACSLLCLTHPNSKTCFKKKHHAGRWKVEISTLIHLLAAFMGRWNIEWFPRFSPTKLFIKTILDFTFVLLYFLVNKHWIHGRISSQSRPSAARGRELSGHEGS